MALLYLSGNVGSEADSNISKSTSTTFQEITIIIPAHKKLKIKKVMYKLNGSDYFRLQIMQHPDMDVWTSTSHSNQEMPNFILHNNISGITNKISVGVMIYNTDNVPHVAYRSGWSVVLGIE